MILVLLLFYPTFSLQQIKSLLPEYILAEDEQVILTLSQYFSGDILQYQISPSSSATLRNPISNLTYHYYSFTSNTSLPISLTNMIPLYPKSYLNQFLLYGTSTEILSFFIDFELILILEGPKLKFEPFTQFQAIASIQVKSVLILTENQELFYLNISYFEYTVMNMTINKLNLTLPLEQVFMSEGTIGDYLLITGYENSEAFAYFYNIKDITSPYLMNKIKVSSGVNKNSPLLAATVYDDHYIVCAPESKLIKFKLDNDSYVIENVLVLDVFSQNVTWIQPGAYDERLLLGIKGGFMIISFDFQQVYTKSGSIFDESVIVYNSGTRDVILTRNSTNYKLYELSDAYDIIQYATFTIDEENFMWNIFTFSYPQHIFIYGVPNGLVIIGLDFVDAVLMLNSSENSTELSLVASQTSPNASVSQSFVVRRPKNNEPGYIEKIGNSLVIVSFNDFSSNTIVPLQDYIVGDNLTIDKYDLNIVSGNSYFSYKIEPIGSLKNSPSIYLNSDNYTSLLASETEIIVYNSSDVALFINQRFYDNYKFSQFDIIKILNCGMSYVFYYKSMIDSGYYLLLLRKINEESSDFFQLESECLSIECSPILIICQNSSGIVIYELNKYLIDIVDFIHNSSLPMPITSVSLAFNNYLILVSNYNNIVVVDLYIYIILHEFKILANETVSYNVIEARSNLLYIYLFANDNQVYMYDNLMNLLKKLTVLNSNNFRLVQEYLISVSDSELQIINTIQFVTNSTVAIISIPPCISFYAIIDKSGLVVYLLYNTIIEVYYIPDNYNSLNLLIEISDFNDIDQIEYAGELLVGVSNKFSREEFNVSLILYVNGETIYKNSSGVEYIQKNNMKYQCGEIKLIPMNSIFVGQGLSGDVVNTKYASLNKRFDQLKCENTLISIDYYLFSSNFNEYIAIFQCTIFILNNEFEPLFQYPFANYSTSCTCYSGSILTDIDQIAFTFGCTIGETILEAVNNIDDFQYMLIFGIIQDDLLIHLSNLTIPYAPQKLRVSSKVSGEFLLAFSENFERLKANSFYSNHFTLIQGNLTDYSITTNQLSCDYSGMFSLNNYYLTDFQVFYDPLFDVYYIYTLDYYFGLRIVSMDFNYSFTPRYTLSLQDPGYSLAVCGSILYVVMENTEIDQYLLKNWITPEFPSRIPPYSLEYSAVQGSLRCSSANFAKYLILQMKNNQGQIFLHVVDTLAKNMSNTVTDYLITDKLNDSIAYTEFLNNSGYLVIVNCSTWQVYLINAFQLVINTNYDCNKGDEQDFKIKVRNILNKTNSVDFKITISKYNQGKVKYGQIEIWQLALICIGAFLLLLLLFLCIRKKCLKHKSKVKTEALFEFEHKYEYIRAEFMNADIKINQSRSSF